MTLNEVQALQEEVRALRELLRDAVNEMCIDDKFRSDYAKFYRVLRRASELLGDDFPAGIYCPPEEDTEATQPVAGEPAPTDPLAGSIYAGGQTCWASGIAKWTGGTAQDEAPEEDSQ
jgi:hypothetical protein